MAYGVHMNVAFKEVRQEIADYAGCIMVDRM
jgi:hypothetical protein